MMKPGDKVRFWANSWCEHFPRRTGLPGAVFVPKGRGATLLDLAAPGTPEVYALVELDLILAAYPRTKRVLVPYADICLAESTGSAKPATAPVASLEGRFNGFSGKH